MMCVKISVILFLSAIACLTIDMRADELAALRDTVGQRMAVEKSIAAEASDWRQTKALLEDLIALRKATLADLKIQVGKSDTTLATADSRRQELVSQRDQLESALVAIQSFTDQTTSKLSEMASAFPSPLRDEIAPFLEKLKPGRDAARNAGLSQRMQAMTAILTAVQKFDATITTGFEIIADPQGNEVEVQTVFIGLSAGFYVSPAEKDAGIGQVVDGKWTWVAQPEIADSVRRALTMAQNSSGEATFISLPFPQPARTIGTPGQ